MSTQTRITRITKPMTDLVILNAETAGAVLQRQNTFVAEVIVASVDQVKVLTESGSVRDAFDAQRAYVRDMGEKLQTTARDNFETIRAASTEAGDVIRGAFRRAEADVAEAVEEVREVAAEAVEQVAEQVSEAVAPAEPAPQY